MLTVTDTAKKQALRLMEDEGKDGFFIRVGVQGGGCSGLMYQLTFDNEEKEGDMSFENNGVKVVVDKKSYLYLVGTTLDFSGGLNGKGFVFQNPDNQIVFPVVSEDIAFGLKRREPNAQVRVARARQALEQVGVPHLYDRLVHTLSGGERQLVALAAVLTTHPEILVFDEPTTQLDLRLRNRVEQYIQALTQPVIVVSHDLDLLRGMDRVLVLRDGVVACDAAPAQAIAWYVEHCS